MTSTILSRRIQVALFWGDTPLDVVQVPDKPGTVMAGSARSCAIALPEDSLPAPEFPLIELDGDQVWIRADSQADIRKEDGSGGWTAAELVPEPGWPGVVGTALPDSGSLKLNLGKLSLLVSRVLVRSIARRRLTESLDPAFLNSLLLACFFASAFLATLLLGPRAEGSADRQLFKHPPHYVIRAISSIPSPVPRIDPSQVKNDLADLNSRSAAAAAGEAGKAGKRRAPDTGKRRSHRAVRPDDSRRISSMGILAALNARGFHGVLGTDSQGLEDDLQEAVGRLQGNEPGDSHGFGGLALIGEGPGAGGPPGSSGIVRGSTGNLTTGTVPRHKAKYAPPKETVLRITHGKAEIIGLLPKKVIKSVIHSHRQQIRYCYGRELTRFPDLAGKLLVHFIIDHRGRVILARATQSKNLAKTSMRDCVLTRVRTWLFPRPNGGGKVEVYYPFLFHPSG